MQANTKTLDLSKQNKHLMNENKYLKMSIAKLQSDLQVLQDQKMNLLLEVQMYSNIEQNWFLSECLRNECLSSHRRYSNEMIKFCEALYITSPKAYKLLREIIKIPSKTILFKKFSGTISNIKSSFLSNELNQKYNLIQRLCLSEKIPVSISIDATVASPHPLFTHDNVNNVSIYYIS